MAFGLPKTLKDETIVDSWATVITGGRGKVDYVFDTVQKLLTESEIPGVEWKMGEVTTGFFSGLFGKKRDYIFVTYEAVKDYKMYVGARDYGAHLDVQWFLTTEPGFFKSMSAKAATMAAAASGSDKVFTYVMDIFAQQDLRAFVTVVHHCVKTPVKFLMEELKQDSSLIDQKSKGFLEVW